MEWGPSRLGGWGSVQGVSAAAVVAILRRSGASETVRLEAPGPLAALNELSEAVDSLDGNNLSFHEQHPATRERTAQANESLTGNPSQGSLPTRCPWLGSMMVLNSLH